MKIKDLSHCLEVDEEVIDSISQVPKQSLKIKSLVLNDFDACADICLEEDIVKPPKYCPKCNKRYSHDENFCFDCLVALKNIDGTVDIRGIRENPTFTFKGKNDFSTLDELLCDKNLQIINDFDFNARDLDEIVKNIKMTAFRRFDKIIKENEIDLESLSVTDRILLFSKSFVNVDYKSYGQELGEFAAGTITLDERLTDTLTITTLIHELAHFLLNEILAETLAHLLDANKNSLFDLTVSHILSDTNFCKLVDEYCAHSTEGRFTVYGFQDYSSFLAILKDLDGEMDKAEVEITKAIGNTFAGIIKSILEAFINEELRDEIRRQFFTDRLDEPNYEMLKLENTEKLTENGFLKAIWLILADGFAESLTNKDNLKKYME